LTDDTGRQSDDRFFSTRRRQFLLVAGVAFVVLAALGMRTIPLGEGHPDFSRSWDHHKYIWMATHNPFGFHVAPFCWRVGAPLLAKTLPFGVERSFSIITFVALWLTGVVVFYIARAFAFARWRALAGMLLFFVLGWAVRANLYNIWKPDPMAFLFIALAIYGITARYRWRFAAVMAAGVFFKESVLFVAPLYYTLSADRWWDSRLAARTLLLTLPGVAVLLAIRALIPSWNDDSAYIAALPDQLRQVQLGSSSYNLSYLWNEIGLTRLRSLSLRSFYDYSIVVFGVTAIALPLFAIRRNLSYLLRFLPFVLLVCAQALFATNVERLIVAGFPVVIIMALTGAGAIARMLRVGDWVFVALFVALITLSLSRTWIVVIPFLYEAAILLGFMALLVSWRLMRRPSDDSSRR
jgi:hypothetical protein